MHICTDIRQVDIQTYNNQSALSKSSFQGTRKCVFVFVHLFCTRNIYFSSIRPWRDPCSVALPEVSSILTPWPETLCIESCVIVCLVLERDIRTFLRIKHECPRRLKDKLVRFWRPKVKVQGQTHYFNSSRIHMMTE